MGIPAPMIAGAIISGAYFGDKMSPLSDTTNLAAGITGTDLFDHIKHMFYTTIPALVIALIAYYILGRQFGNSELNNQNIVDVMTVLNENFVISPWLLLVPVIVIALVAMKVPAIPSLAIGIFLGWVCHIFVQGGSVADAVNTLQVGYAIETGNALVDDLFNRGGIDAMMYTVSLTIVAMAFGGVMESTGMLRAIVDQILKLARSARSLVATTVLSATFTNVAAAEQYISILLPGRMYAQAFRDKNLQSKNLSRALEDGGTVTSALVPWNTCGVFILATLSVHPFEYAPYAILNWSVPIISIIFSILGFKISFMSEAEREKVQQELAEEEGQEQVS
jgi:NhaC family Na+:H+ antiporter